jgi:hypothetical protein
VPHPFSDGGRCRRKCRFCGLHLQLRVRGNTSPPETESSGASFGPFFLSLFQVTKRNTS